MTTAQAGETKRILFYGDSNTFGWITHAGGTFDRFFVSETRAGRTAKLLGADYEVIIEELGGRTANIDCDPNFGSGYISGAGMNGAAFFPHFLQKSLETIRQNFLMLPLGFLLNAKNHCDLANALAPKGKQFSRARHRCRNKFLPIEHFHLIF